MMEDIVSDYMDRLFDTGSWIGKPFVYEGNGSLSLHFDIGATQSQMCTADPYQLMLGYTRTMMGFLLFRDAPRRIGMIGLGGGSLPKFCYRHLPASDITVVEISPDVIALREQFHVPADDQRFRVLCEDGAAYVARCTDELDVLLVDGFDLSGQAPELCSQRFYDDCYAALADDGVMVVNLSGVDHRTGAYIARIRRAFEHSLVVIKSEDCTNRILYAIKGAGLRISDKQLTRQARLLEGRYPLQFQATVSRLIGNRRPRHDDGAATIGATRQDD